MDARGGLLVGTGGSKGRVLRVDKPGDKPREIFSEKDVQYVWAVKELPDGEVYAATGPNGQLFVIHPDGSHEVLFKSSENNLTALATDGKDLLYVGTDPNGLVVRVDRKTKESFVLYNAGETEVTALVLDVRGDLYAATGESSVQQQPTPPEAANKERTGRPEATPGAEPPLPSNPPTPPKPPEAPNPNPGEPAPIPKKIVWRHAAARHDEPQMLVTQGPPAQPMLADDPQLPPEDQPGVPDQPPGDQPNGSAQAGAGKNAAPGAKPNAATEPPKAEGNAIYRIDPEGFVTEVFRQPVVILSMVENRRRAAGRRPASDGLIYQVNPAAEETVVLAKVDAKQVLAMLPPHDGRVLLGLANAGGIAAMSRRLCRQGHVTPARCWTPRRSADSARSTCTARCREGTALTVATRSGNVQDADGQGWSTVVGRSPPPRSSCRSPSPIGPVPAISADVHQQRRGKQRRWWRTWTWRTRCRTWRR